MAPFGGVAAAKSLPHASAVTSVTHPQSRSARVAKFAIVGVWLLFRESWIVVPQPPVWRSTKLGTLPAATLRPKGAPLSAPPSRNCALVQTDATVVNSFIVTCAGGVGPITESIAMQRLSPPPLCAFGSPPFAMTYSTLGPLLGPSKLKLKRPSSLVCA